jgi:hypothetical protein
MQSLDVRVGNTTMPPPRLIPKGNVAKSEKVVKAFSSLETYIDERYTSRRTLAFLPSKLRKMREKCLAGNDLGELMIWVILLLSSKQYLRACEVLELMVESWKMNYAAISDSDVESILLSVLGKREGVKDVHLQCWTDCECPNFLRPQRYLFG